MFHRSGTLQYRRKQMSIILAKHLEPVVIIIMSFPVKYVGCPNPMSNSEIDRKIHSLVAYDMRLFAILYPVNVLHHFILSPPAAECELLCDIYCYFMQLSSYFPVLAMVIGRRLSSLGV